MPLPSRLAALHRLFAVTLLGFASGLPLALIAPVLGIQFDLSADALVVLTVVLAIVELVLVLVPLIGVPLLLILTPAFIIFAYRYIALIYESAPAPA